MLTEKNIIDVKGTMQGERIAMTIDQSALVHIMGIMTDLYADPELAVIREYSTNARDSHIAAGFPERPIEVTTPTHLSPFLRIRDYGIGMNQGDIRDIYSQYGASTKRHTNELSGVLGLGCKSALTYTSQFTLTGVKGGVATVVQIGRDEDGAGTMTIVSSEPSDLPNGVEVTIPAKRINDMYDKAVMFFSYWDLGTVLLNGQPVTSIKSKGARLADDLYLVDRKDGYDDHIIVMGGVPYPAPSISPSLAWATRVVAFVEMGDVQFTPSREALQDTRKTRACITNIEHRVKNGILQAATAEINNASSRSGALRIAFQWRVKTHSLGSLEFRGEVIPDMIRLNNPATVVPVESYAMNTHQRTQIISINTFDRCLLAHGYDLKYTGHHKKKILKYLEENVQYAHIRHIILSEDPLVNEWVDAPRIPWADIAAMKLTTATARSTKKLKGSYEAWEGGVHVKELAASDIKVSKKIFWMNGDAASCRNRVDLLTVHYPGCTLVRLPENRIQKFCRDFPTAKTVREGLNKAYEKLAKKVTPQQIVHYNLTNLGGWEERALQNLDPDRIDDPDVAQAIRIVQSGTSHSLPVAFLQLYKIRYSFGGADILTQATASPLQPYSFLLNNGGWKFDWKHPHIYLYMNAVYNTKESK